uniref:Uncharacterized protein n=1 Tax=Panagrolaimus superbus TaxID=310955 RepID=A0A914YT18_9BILA
MALSHRLPYLDGEPKKSIGIAPPPYKINPDDDSSTSGRWSDSSFSSATGGALGKRRTSWTNLVEADENLKNYKVNVYPKVSSTSSTTSFNSNNQQHLNPLKAPFGQVVSQLPQGVAMNGSNISVNSQYGGGAAQPVNYQLKPPSRQNSYTANNSMVSEFFVLVCLKEILKFRVRHFLPLKKQKFQT